MEQPGLAFDRDVFDVPVPAAKRSHASRAAAERLRATRAQGPKMAKLLTAYAQAAPATLIDSDVEQITHIMRGSICSLRAAAVDRGWLQAIGTRTGPYGAPQTTHRLTAAGRAALADWQRRQTAKQAQQQFTKGPSAA